MKILFVSHTFPHLPDDGIKLPVYNILKESRALGHNITLISFIKKEERKYLKEIDI